MRTPSPRLLALLLAFGLIASPGDGRTESIWPDANSAPSVPSDPAAPAASSVAAGPLGAAAAPDPFVARFEQFEAEARRRSRDPHAALLLWRAFELRHRLPTLAPLASLFSSLADSNGAHPEVRSLARYLAGLTERARGRLVRARDHFARLGFVTRFQVAGPFDNEGRSGCNTQFDPESSLDLAARYHGKAREIGWRELPEAGPEGYVDLGSAVSPSNDSVTYALAILEAESDSRALLHLGASGATRLWVNGTRVLSDDRVHPPRFDQARVAVGLKKGSNRVLLKLCQSSGPHGFLLRVTSPGGSRLGGVRVTTPAPLLPEPKGRVVFDEVPTLVDLLRTRAGKAPRDARARASYAEALFAWQAFDVTDRRDAAEAAAAARLAPRDFESLLLAAATAHEPNERRAWLEAALKIAPDDPRATEALARDLLARDFPRRALDLLEPALAAHPDWFSLALLKARALEDLGLGARAALLAGELADRWPDRPEVVREAARLARRFGRVERAVELWRVALALRYDDEEARRSLVAALVDRGEVEAALKEQHELHALAPFSVQTWLRSGELAAANGRPQEAQRAFARAVEIAPDDPEVHERRGHALARAGDTAAGIASLSRALALRPQNAQLKEALKALRQEGRGFGEDLAHDARKLALESPAAPGEDAATLAQLVAIKVFPSGLSSRFEQVVVRLQTARGVEEARHQWITWSPDRQELTILRARLIKPDGSVLSGHSESERSLSDEGSRLYYDARARLVSFQNAAPGDVLELAWRLDDTAHDNLLSDYFGDVQMLNGEHPTARLDYYVLAPPGRPLYSNAAGLPVKSEQRREPDGSTLHHWWGRELPKIVAEPGMPGAAEVATPLHVSTYKDWDAVGRTYWGMVRDQLTPTDEIKSTARELVARLPPGDELAAVRAVYNFVVSRTRYVGLEFGIHSFKPYKVDQVLARRFGDCKDKASLMHALLEAVGIDSRLVLLRMRRNGRLGPEPASLSVFDHAILYVPKFDLWLDGTAEHFGSRELPVEDRGATVLVVEPKGGSKLGRIPEGDSAANVNETSQQVVLEPTGTARVEGRTVVSGLFAPEYRRAYQAPATRKRHFEQGWGRVFPGASVRELEISDPTALEKDVELKWSLEVPRLASWEDGALTFLPFGHGATYVESYAPLSKRQHDLVLAYPWTGRSRSRVRPPASASVAPLPAPVVEKGRFGSFRVEYRLEGGEVVVESEITLSQARIASRDYPEFRAFLARLDQALGRKLKLLPVPAKGATAEAR